MESLLQAERQTGESKTEESAAPLGRWHRPALISLADQAVFSGSMLLVNILLARWTSPEEFGAFAVLYAVFLIFAGFHNALIVEPMSVFGARKEAAARQVYFRHVYLMHGAVVAVLAMIACLGVVFLGGESLRTAKWALPIAIPLAMTFWLARRACYVESRPGRALGMSTLYAILTVLGLSWLSYTDSLSTFSAFMLFGLAGFIVSLPTASKALLQRRPQSPTPMVSSIKQHLSYGRWSLGESIAFALSMSILPLAIAYFMDLGEAGKFRAVQILFLPLAHLLTGLGLMLLPTMSRHRVSAPIELYASRARVMLALFVGLSITYVLPILVFGSNLLTLIYQDPNYLDLVSLLPYLGLSAVAGAASAAMMIVLRSSERPDLVFLSTAAGAVVMLSFGIAMIAAFGAGGVAAALILNSCVTAILLAWSSRSLLFLPAPAVGHRVEEGVNV
jgi:O-antigen/teichoic acid export membrane protein